MENFFVTARKIDENTTRILKCYFQTKFTFWDIKLNIYMYEIKFASLKKYLFGLLISRKARPKYTASFFALSEKK